MKFYYVFDKNFDTYDLILIHSTYTITHKIIKNKKKFF